MACLLYQLSLGWGEPQKSQGDLKLTYVAKDGCELLILILSGGGHMYVLCATVSGCLPIFRSCFL